MPRARSVGRRGLFGLLAAAPAAVIASPERATSHVDKLVIHVDDTEIQEILARAIVRAPPLRSGDWRTS